MHIFVKLMDYAIRGALQQRVYHQRQFKTVEELKRAIVTKWQKLSQRFIDNSINESVSYTHLTLPTNREV